MRQRQQAHKRSRLTNRMLIGATALLLGGGGLAAYATTALAGNQTTPGTASGHQHTASGITISCPDVGERLRTVPRSAQLPVSKGLSALDKQVHDAYHKMMGGSGTAVMAPLKAQREKTIKMMVTAIAKNTKRPGYLIKMSGCTTKPVDEGAGAGGNDSTKSVQDGWYQGQTQNQTQGDQQGQQQGQQSQDPNQQQGQDPNQQGQNGGQQGQAGGPSPTTSWTSPPSSRTRTPRRSPPPREATPRRAPSPPSAGATRTATSTPTTSS